MQTARHQAQRERFTALLNSRLVFAADAGQGSDHARALTMMFHGNHPLTPSFHSHAALQEGELPVDRWVELLSKALADHSNTNARAATALSRLRGE